MKLRIPPIDTDDGLRAGVFTLGELLHCVFRQQHSSRAGERGTDIAAVCNGACRRPVSNVSGASGRPKSYLADVHHCKSPLIDFSAAMQEDLKELRAFLWKRFYLKGKVTSRAQRAGKPSLPVWKRTYKIPPPR